MRRLFLLGSVLALGAATGLSIHLVTAGGSSARSGRVTLKHTRGAPRGALVLGRKLLGVGAAPTMLAASASAPLVGNIGPVAAPSRDGRYIAYNTWRWTKTIDWQQSLSAQGIHAGDPLGTPTLRIRDVRKRVESALEEGSMSVAWRSDGAVAYVRGIDPSYRANKPYLREVVVRARIGAPPVVWSRSPEPYVVQGWAGRRLIVRRDVEGGSPDLLVFDAPRSARPLASHAELLAISPSGSDVLVAESLSDTPDPAIRLVSVTDGREEGRIRLSEIVDPVSGGRLSLVVGLGNWRHDRVVVPSSSGLLVLHVSGGTLSVDQVLHVDSATQPGGGFYEPRFTGDDEHTIVTWADLPASSGKQSAQFVCDRYALTCTQGAPLSSSAAPRPIFDESGGDQ